MTFIPHNEDITLCKVADWDHEGNKFMEEANPGGRLRFTSINTCYSCLYAGYLPENAIEEAILPKQSYQL